MNQIEKRKLKLKLLENYEGALCVCGCIKFFKRWTCLACRTRFEVGFEDDREMWIKKADVVEVLE